MLIVGVHLSGKKNEIVHSFRTMNIAYLLGNTAQTANDVFAWIF